MHNNFMHRDRGIRIYSFGDVDLVVSDSNSWVFALKKIVAATIEQSI